MHLVRCCDTLTKNLRWVSINDDVQDPVVLDAAKWAYVGLVSASNGYVSPLTLAKFTNQSK